MTEEIVRKIFKNKTNNQRSVTLPSKLFKKTDKKFLDFKKIKIKDWEFIE